MPVGALLCAPGVPSLGQVRARPRRTWRARSPGRGPGGRDKGPARGPPARGPPARAPTPPQLAKWLLRPRPLSPAPTLPAAGTRLQHSASSSSGGGGGGGARVGAVSMLSGGRERRALTRAPWRARRRWILAAPGASCSRLGRRGPGRRGRRERKRSRSPPPAPPAPPAKPRPPAGAREPGRRVPLGPRQERPREQVGHLPGPCTDR